MKNIFFLEGKIKQIELWMIALLLLVASPAFSQVNRSISGTIVDENGESIIGANVMESGHKGLGTITDADGHFKLSIPVNSVLEVSFVGYVTKKVKVDTKATYNIVLQEDLQLLDEVVVVGYGTQKKATITGSVSAVDNKEITTTKSNNIQNMLPLQLVTDPKNFRIGKLMECCFRVFLKKKRMIISSKLGMLLSLWRLAVDTNFTEVMPIKKPIMPRYGKSPMTIKNLSGCANSISI